TIGYSTGAKLAVIMLFNYRETLKGDIFNHPMETMRGIQLPDLSGKRIFMAAGTNDPICSPQESEELASLFEEAGAGVKLHWEKKGHQLTIEEVEAAGEWYATV